MNDNDQKVNIPKNMNLRDFRIVLLARGGMTYDRIADLLLKYGNYRITKQRISQIVQKWEGLEITYEDDTVTIH